MKYREKLPAHREKRRWLETAWTPYGLVTVCITAVFLLVMAWQELYPFGDWSLANSDGSNQYLNFYTYFRNLFYTNNDLNYSFSEILGGNMQGLYAYYLASPVYLLMVLFPQEQILLALHLVIYLKLLGAGLCFCAWAGYRKKGNVWMRVALAVSYAFMGYGVTFYNLLSWLDAMALLPLIALGLERLVRERKPLIYGISLGVAIMTNYYVGFMVCVAAVLFYAVLLFVSREGIWKTIKRTGLLFVGTSLWAGMLSAWILIPAIRALPTGRFQDSQSVFGTLHENFSLFRVFSKLFTGATTANEFFAGLPTIFVGIVPLVLVVLFFLNTGIRRRGRAAAAAVLLFLIFSFHHKWLNILWHGFTQNQMFNYRYSFVFSFLMLAVAWHGVCQWQELPKRAFAYCGAILAAGILLVFTVDYSYGTPKERCLDVFLAATGLLLAFFAVRKKRFAAMLLVGLVLLNSLANSGLSIRGIRGMYGSAQQSQHTKFLDSTQKALNLIPEDEEFFRVEKTFHQSYCDNMALNIPGVSNFSSVERSDSTDFARKMGMRCYSAWARYTGENSVAAESLLGISYVLTKDDPEVGRENYALLGTVEGIGVYKNPYALPLFMGSPTLSNDGEGKDGFLFQNDCWSSLVTEEMGSIFAQAESNWTKAEEDRTYTLICTMPVDGNAYLHFTGEYFGTYKPFGVELCEPPEKVLKMDSSQDTYLLGAYEKNDRLVLKITLEQGVKEEALDAIRVYGEDLAVLEAYAQAVQSREVSVQKVTSSHLTVRYTTNEESPYLVSTIPYDEGWAVTVDGKETPIVKNWGCMLAFEVAPGEHVIELRYHPPGKTLGCGITLGAIVLPLLYGLIRTVKNGKTVRPPQTA